MNQQTNAGQGATTVQVQIPPHEPERLAQEFRARVQASLPSITVILWEGNWCTQDSRAVVADTPRIRGGWNDEARSLTFYGPAGSVVSVFDSDNYRTDDDFAIIIKTDDNPICVGSFQNFPAQQWGQRLGYSFFYSGGNGLDGKVTSVRFGQWW
jgi:hypothetical protein